MKKNPTLKWCRDRKILINVSNVLKEKLTDILIKQDDEVEFPAH